MYEKWPFFLYVLIVVSRSESLSIDETLRPKDSYVIINQYENNGIRDAVEEHFIHKRSADPPSNITVNPTDLKDNHQQLLVHWPGNNSNVFICLARNTDPIVPAKKPTPSAVYISYDYGVHFENVTNFFSLGFNNSYASVDKFYNHPRNQNYMVFLDKYNQMLFVTKNFGVQITKVKPLFQPMEILFYPEDPFIFLAYDVNKTLWITRDFGGSFSIVQEFVKSYAWAERWSGTWADTPTRSLLVQRIEPSGNTTLLALGNLVTSNQPSITVKMHNIEQFSLNDNFIFVTRRLSPTNNDLYISYRGGDFYKAVFDSELEKGNFHVTDVSDVRVMVAVVHNETLCNLYISEVVTGSNYTFRISLERLFCFFPHKMWTESWLSDVAEETFADLHKVQGIRGVYLASQVTPLAKSDNINPEHLRTLITFDWGAEWRTVIPPTVDEIGRPFPNCNPSNCTLHLTQKFMNLYPFTRTVPILSSASAPGLIVATGVLGTSLKEGDLGVFVSRDAGLTWKKVLRENYIYNFGDHGGIMTAVKYFKSIGETEELLYSTDEGEKWSSLKFINERIRVYNLMTEPGENTTWFTLFGSKIDKHGWMIINVDLRNAFSYNCTKDDYKMWIPSSGSKPRQIKMSCVMGLEETFERRIQHSNCYNGKNYDRPILKQPCPCDIEDFECDFGFLRHVNSAGCIRNKSTVYDPYKVPDSCKPGTFYNRTKGYRKIDGDACISGYDWQYLPEQIPCPFNETSNFLILALKKEILRFNLAEPKPKPEVLPVNNLSNVIAIDFDMKHNCLFYGDLENDVIVRQCLSGKKPPEVLIRSGLKSVEGLAYDWVSQMLYFVDSSLVKIEAARTDIEFSNRMRKTVLNNTVLDKPRGIALHPVAGYLYWTDWSLAKPLIGRSNLDGSHVKQLFTAPVVHWPNGITVDHIAEQIYWVDAKLDYIAAADLHGRNLKKIIANVKQLTHPFAVAVFKDLMYWDDWEQKRVFVADKDHGVGIRIVTDEFEGLMDLKVYAHSLQEGTNACSNSSSVCSHLCFAQPDNKPPVCACPDNMTVMAGECVCLDGSKPFANHTCPKNVKCLANQFTCANNYSCIPLSWQCNGINECGDNSDEVDCPDTSCGKKHVKCKNGRCIPLYWVCDAEEDCTDGSDEWNCTKPACTKDQFTCKNGQCISKRWRCDGESDCKDQSDEIDCPVIPSHRNCTDKEFRCPDQVETCIPKSWVCDGESDCPLNKDEENCPAKQCDEKSQFQCVISKRCIYKQWVCDNETDCGQGDNSDEENCSTTTPATTTAEPSIDFGKCNKEFMFKCTYGKCIPDWWKCDGVTDCDDKSDEAGCKTKNSTVPSTPPSPSPFPHNCKSNEFQCKSGECIPSSWTCDGLVDCEDGKSDETNCDSAQSCPKDYIKCHLANTCYLATKACDGQYDCPDHSDETDCANKATETVHKPGCPIGYFKCDGSSCIPLFKFCDGHKDCYDETDETDCKPTSRVYQVMKFSAIESSTTSTSLPIRWYINSPSDLKFEFLPSISVVTSRAQHQDWSNGTWTPNFEYTFEKLSPYTEYNITVYVRINSEHKEFPPAFYFTAMTKEDIPSPPWNVSAVQKSTSTVEVSWKIPHQPNGVIREYVIHSTPPLPPIDTTVPSKNLSAIVSTIFTPEKQYSFWVVAKNGAGTSNSSEIVKIKSQPEANLSPIENFNVKCSSEKVTTCELDWQEVKGAEGYRIVTSAYSPYPVLPEVIVKATHFKFPVLAPGVEYNFQISALHKNFEGPVVGKSARTAGKTLPAIDSKHAFVNGTSIRLTWKEPSGDNRKIGWLYGIYYGLTLKDMFQGPKVTTENVVEKIEGLESCETFLFDVGVVGPVGVGPLSQDPIKVLTNYSKSAPPKALTLYTDPQNETLMVISWTSSCNVITEPISYIINIEELVHGKNTSIKFRPANSTKFQHRILVDYGARYRVTVQTGEPNSIKTKPVEHWAPPLPVPHQVKVEPHNSSYMMHWQIETKLKKMPRYEFEIMVCEGEEFDEKMSSKTRTKAAPFFFHEMKVATPYTVAVRLVSDQGFISSVSEINTIQIPLGPSMVVVSEVGLLSAIIPAALVFIALVAFLALYVMKHYRLRNTFTTFANSHYSTSSGAAIFTDRLDDEDSPVIRGFSDDEPLVVA